MSVHIIIVVSISLVVRPHCNHGSKLNNALDLIWIRVASWLAYHSTLWLWWQNTVMLSHIITIVTSWLSHQAPHYCHGDKPMGRLGHTITMVTSQWAHQTTVSLWWQTSGHIRPHYHYGDKPVGTSAHAVTGDKSVGTSAFTITMVTSQWAHQATLSLWWQASGCIRPPYHYGDESVGLSGHTITMVTSQWARQATLSL